MTCAVGFDGKLTTIATGFGTEWITARSSARMYCSGSKRPSCSAGTWRSVPPAIMKP